MNVLPMISMYKCLMKMNNCANFFWLVAALWCLHGINAVFDAATTVKFRKSTLKFYSQLVSNEIR